MNYRKSMVLGIPGTYLDSEVFYEDAPFLENAPFLSTLIANPNHIGCHTIGETEKIFKGTQEMEREMISICAEQVFGGNEAEQDGYVASGGTEANIQALWIYRNYFVKEYDAKINEIAVVYSEDSHYSFAKGANLLNLRSLVVNVNSDTRAIDTRDLKTKIRDVQKEGVNFFIVNLNLSTTMFGSVDDIDTVVDFLAENNLNFRLHIDAAFGGFIYPFTNPENSFSFKNAYITSITIDAHKMMQTPYGTGIFLIRKGFMKYVCTEEAQYVTGKDHTLCGSRSGANAIAIWMILHNYGSEGWKMKMQSLVDRTTELCCQLDKLGIEYFRNPFLNIIAIRAKYISSNIADKFVLVPDKHEDPHWWKIVMMPHITKGNIDTFISELKTQTQSCISE
ncbi:MAG: PLP-dependent enzyme glutamate decarboxylase [Bacteroidota bacterium]|jgi:glutamate/tyrosine decarboxylase-like PLP-dependent enzyme|nr:PLP-dependent enzyme glutamate decarboxylase [Bacteroidota bacterium]